MLPRCMAAMATCFHTVTFLPHPPPRRNVERRGLLEHMDALMLILDELVDGG